MEDESSILASKMEAMRKLVTDTKERQADMQDRIAEVSVTNEMLVNSYESSLEIIADLSEVLYQYMTFFTEMDHMLEGLRVDHTQRDKVEHAKQLNKLGSKSIHKTSLRCFEQLSHITPLYKQNDLSTHCIDGFARTLEEVYNKTKQDGRSLRSREG